jgi:DNA-dependent protein kinase catalytic subunit
MEAKDVRLMFKIIIEICERTFFLNQTLQQQIQSQSTEIFDEKIYQLPSFIEALACVCNQIDDNLPEGTVSILEKLVLLAIDSYPKLIKRYNYQISLAIARLFIAIQLGKGSFYTDFIARIVYQSMIRIFSYKTNYFLMQDPSENINRSGFLENETGTMVDEENATKNLQNITSTDYVMFWSNLLNLSEFKELNLIGVHINDRRRVVGHIYDEFVETLIRIMNKLDLNADKLDLEESNKRLANQNDSMISSNPIAGLRPKKPKDFEILVNLVDFSK